MHDRADVGARLVDLAVDPSLVIQLFLPIYLPDWAILHVVHHHVLGGYEGSRE